MNNVKRGISKSFSKLRNKRTDVLEEDLLLNKGGRTVSGVLSRLHADVDGGDRSEDERSVCVKTAGGFMLRSGSAHCFSTEILNLPLGTVHMSPALPLHFT